VSYRLRIAIGILLVVGATAVGVLVSRLSVSSAASGAPTATSSTSTSTGSGEVSDEAPITFAPVSGSGIPTFGSPNAALDSALSNEFQGTKIESATFGNPPTNVPDQGGLWLDVTVSADDATTGASLGDWEAAMLVGQLRDELKASGLTAVEGYSLTIALPNGDKQALGGAAPGNIAYGQTFVNLPPDTITQMLQADAAAVGAKIQSVTYLPTLDPAPIITLSTADPTAFAQTHTSLGAIFQDSGPFEGYYVELDNSAGSPVEIGTASFRSGVGSSWYAPGLGLGDGQASGQ
jgi:hypothetical protein